MLKIVVSDLFYDGLRTVGIIYMLLNQLLINFKICQLNTWFLLLHLSYYSISYRISNLTSFIESERAKYQINEMENDQNVAIVTIPATSVPNQLAKALRKCGYLFDQICQATHEINATFSLPILLFLTMVMILCSICLFFFIYVIAELVEHLSIKNFFYVFPAVFALGLMITLVLLISADYPIKQVNFLQSHLISWSN